MKVEFGIAVTKNNEVGVAMRIDEEHRVAFKVEGAMAMAGRIHAICGVLRVVPILADFLQEEMELSEERAAVFMERFMERVVAEMNGAME